MNNTNTNIKKKHKGSDSIRFIELLHNMKNGCADYNYHHLIQLKEPIAEIHAIHSCSAAERLGSHNFEGLETILNLAAGARVILSTNLCANKGLVNGAFGTVKAILYERDTKPASVPKAVIVQFDKYKNSPKCVAITPQIAVYSKNGKTLSRYQIPLKLASSITIHKSQGQTIDKCVINLEKSFYAKGMQFV